jgi:hypothetical protein
VGLEKYINKWTWDVRKIFLQGHILSTAPLFTVSALVLWVGMEKYINKWTWDVRNIFARSHIEHWSPICSPSFSFMGRVGKIHK